MITNMSVRDFLGYALEDFYTCKVYSFTNGVVLDGTIADVLDSEYANSELHSFDVDDGKLCVNIDGYEVC